MHWSIYNSGCLAMVVFSVSTAMQARRIHCVNQCTLHYICATRSAIKLLRNYLNHTAMLHAMYMFAMIDGLLSFRSQYMYRFLDLLASDLELFDLICSCWLPGYLIFFSGVLIAKVKDNGNGRHSCVYFKCVSCLSTLYLFVSFRFVPWFRVL